MEQSALAAQKIDERIAELGDWRSETLTWLRALIREADPEITEEWKWEVPVWSRGGVVCTGETYKAAVKMTFVHGAALADPAGLFNASLKGGTRRAIDLREGERPDAETLQALIREAAAHNLSRKRG